MSDDTIENLWPRAYQIHTPHTSSLTRVLKSVPEQVAIDALDSLNWFEPVGFLSHSWNENGHREGNTGWAHPLTAVLWAERPAVSRAAIEKASAAIEAMKESSFMVKMDRAHMFMENWVGENVVHQAVLYSPVDVIRHLLGKISTHGEGQGYLPVDHSDKNLLATMGLYGRRDRSIKEWQQIIRLIDDHVLTHSVYSHMGNGHKMSAHQKRMRAQHHALLYRKALEGGHEALVEAVQGLRQVKVPLYLALNSALKHNNATTALHVIRNPTSEQRAEQADQTENALTILASNLGRAAKNWSTSAIFVPAGLDPEAIRSEEIQALQQLVVFFAQDLKKFPLMASHASSEKPRRESPAQPLSEASAEDRPISPSSDFPLLMAPALALLDAAQVEAIGVDWACWPKNNDPLLKGLPTLEEWQALPACPWQERRGMEVELATQDPTRQAAYRQTILDALDCQDPDWKGPKGQRSAALIHCLFNKEPDPAIAAEAWWSTCERAAGIQGTVQDTARRQAWLAAFLPQPATPRRGLRF